LDQPLFVDAWTQLFQIDSVLYRLSEVRDELDVDLACRREISIRKWHKRGGGMNIGFY
jgi:hypothetical protein